ncbi:MAG: RNA-binding S4 domain-containing protein [Peptococcia bacterium]|jgi:ribosomal 50S subunit-recycling heat shock protein
MRLDKFLKVSRLIKRRTLAKEITNAGRVSLNGRVAKPGTEVNPGDILEIGFGSRQIKVEVLEVKDNVRADEAKNLYKIIE